MSYADDLRDALLREALTVRCLDCGELPRMSPTPPRRHRVQCACFGGIPRDPGVWLNINNPEEPGP